MTVSAFTSIPGQRGHRQITQCDPRHDDLRGDHALPDSLRSLGPTHPISDAPILDNEVGRGYRGSVKDPLALRTFLCRSHGSLHLELASLAGPLPSS